jgi:hypothetical protein
MGRAMDRADGGHLLDPLVFEPIEGEVRHLSIERTCSRLVAACTGRLGELTPRHDLGVFYGVVFCEVYSVVGSREVRG